MANKRMEEVLKYCKRDNLDKRRLEEFEPKNRPELKNLPIYNLRDIDRLHDMIEAEHKHYHGWFSAWVKVNSHFSLLQELDINNLGYDIIEVLEKPFDEMPLMINECEPRVNLFVRWRLKIGK